MRTQPLLIAIGLLGAAIGRAGAPAPMIGSGRIRIRAISAGGAHTCALASNGIVRCWGKGGKGQTGDPVFHAAQARPDQAPAISLRAIGVATGRETTCLVTLKKGLRCMGVSDEGQLGSGFDLDYTAIPERIPGILADAASVALGDGHACALNRQGGVQCWGAGSRGQLGVRDWYDPWKAGRLAPLAATLHPPRAGEEAGTAAAGGSEGPKSAGLASGARSPTQAGWKMPEELDADEENGRISRVPLTVDGLATGAMQVAAGAAHSCAVTSRGQLRCWGSNAFGQIGDGSRTTRISPVVVSGLETGVMQVALGAAHSCALMSDRSVRCWGTNARGELGDGSGEEHLTPVEVKGLGAPVSRLSVGAFHSCALLSTGVVKCWGYNRSGQLGDGSGANSLLPVTVKGLPAKITQLAAGAAHTCALDEAGDLYCWGSNAQGQLGNGLSGERNNALTAVQALDPGFGAASR